MLRSLPAELASARAALYRSLPPATVIRELKQNHRRCHTLRVFSEKDASKSNRLYGLAADIQ